MNTQTPPSADLPPRRTRWGCWVLGIGLAALVFMAAIYPMGRIMPRAIHTDTRNTCHTLTNALDQFQNEYQRFPFTGQTPAKEDLDEDTRIDGRLVRALKGFDIDENPRQQDFLGDIKQASWKDGKARSGLLEEGDAVGLVDPWGRAYRVRYDADEDGSVENPQRDSPETRLRKSMIAWSAGKDGDFDTWDDNVWSWSE